MEAVKRLEIVTDSVELRLVIDALESRGITGYTIVPDVVGRGDRGRQRGDDVSGVGNSYLLTTCAPGRVSEIVEAIRPILRKRGGICLVSDAQWVVH